MMNASSWTGNHGAFDFFPGHELEGRAGSRTLWRSPLSPPTRRYRPSRKMPVPATMRQKSDDVGVEAAVDVEGGEWVVPVDTAVPLMVGYGVEETEMAIPVERWRGCRSTGG